MVQESGVGGQGSGVRDRESGVRRRKSEVRGQRSEVRVGLENTTISVAPRSPPFQGGGDRALARWGGSAPLVGPSGIYYHAPSPKSVCGIGASPMSRRRCELRRFGEGEESKG